MGHGDLWHGRICAAGDLAVWVHRTSVNLRFEVSYGSRVAVDRAVRVDREHVDASKEHQQDQVPGDEDDDDGGEETCREEEARCRVRVVPGDRFRPFGPCERLLRSSPV